MTEVTTEQGQGMPQLSAADEQVLRELAERARGRAEADRRGRPAGKAAFPAAPLGRWVSGRPAIEWCGAPAHLNFPGAVGLEGRVQPGARLKFRSSRHTDLRTTGRRPRVLLHTNRAPDR